MERSGSVVFGIILVILFLVIMLGPILRRLFVPMIHRWIMGKMEDKVRRMAGMPTRKEERMARKQARRRENGGAARFRKAAEKSRARNRQRQPHSTIGLLNSLAEDVEFTEIREYSQYVEIGKSTNGKKDRIIIEEQIEDAEFTEIKKHS